MEKLLKTMRGLVCLLLATVMLAGCLPAQAEIAGSTTLAQYGENYVVNASCLNVRSGPGTEYKVITGVKRGETVIRGIRHIDRGYESFERDLALLGAKIRREQQ